MTRKARGNVVVKKLETSKDVGKKESRTGTNGDKYDKY